MAWHRHKWRVRSSTFTPSHISKYSIKSAEGDPEHMLSVILGVTNIREECKKCGKTNVITVPGKAD